MDAICRVCSIQSSSLTSVFSLQNGRVISDMISIICPIRIELSDIFPKSICSSCIKIIFDAVDLRERSIQSDQNFKSGNFQFQIEPTVRIKIEKDPFNHELWLEDESNNFPNINDDSENSDSNEDDDNDHNDADYYPEMPLKIKSEHSNRHKCPECPETFTHSNNVRSHVVKYHPDVDVEKPKLKVGKASCSMCGFQLAHASNVKRHMLRYHDPTLPFGCDECTCRFINESRLKTHIEKTHKLAKSPKIQKVESQIVKESFKEPQQQPLVKHESILCDLCGKNFANRTLLERHLTITHKPKDLLPVNEDESNFMSGCYPCSLCDKTFTMRHNLNRHYKRFHSSDLQFECNQCNNRFRTEVHLNRHVIRVHENRNGIFNKINEAEAPSEVGQGEEILEKCQYCDQEFNGSKYRFERHMILMHEKELEKIFSCDICPKKFVFLKSLKYHVEVHRKRAREENFPFKCAACLRKFLNEDKYKHHITYSHAETSTYVCYLCGITLDSRKKLNYHMIRHQNIRNYQCSQCGMKFLQSKHLDRHLTTHSDLRPYVCEYNGCGKSFKMSDVLKKHIRNVHQNANSSKTLANEIANYFEQKV